MFSKRRILVIGGTGFIGKHLTTRLVQMGHTPVAVGRSRSAPVPDGAFYQSGKASDAIRMAELIQGCDTVYDLSLGGGETWADYEREVVQAAAHIAEACLTHGVRRFIYASSIVSLYLGRPGSTLTEADGFDYDRRMERSFYSRGKMEAERRLLDLHASRGLPVVIFRPGVVAGPGGRLVHGAVGDGPNDIAIRGWGPGHHPLPWVLASDVAAAMAAAMETPGVEGMAFNLAGDVRPSAAEYVSQLRQRSYRNFRFYPQSLLLMKADETVRWWIKKLIRKPDAVRLSNRDLESLTMATQLDCSLAKQKLGWRPETDPEMFYRQVIDCHLPSISPGDLRLEA